MPQPAPARSLASEQHVTFGDSSSRIDDGRRAVSLAEQRVARRVALDRVDHLARAAVAALLTTIGENRLIVASRTFARHVDDAVDRDLVGALDVDAPPCPRRTAAPRSPSRRPTAARSGTPARASSTDVQPEEHRVLALLEDRVAVQVAGTRSSRTGTCSDRVVGISTVPKRVDSIVDHGASRGCRLMLPQEVHQGRLDDLARRPAARPGRRSASSRT